MFIQAIVDVPSEDEHEGLFSNYTFCYSLSKGKACPF